MASAGSSKEVKAALKAARDAIRQNEWKEALKHCKSVLKLDKENYSALLFVGKCAGELGQADQAVAAFRKAIDINGQQTAAWQGLCALYERHEENQEFQAELVNVYERLQQLYTSIDDDDKSRSVGLKLAKLYQNQGNLLQAALCWLAVAGEGEDRLAVLGDAVLAFTQLKQLDGETEEMMEKALVELCQSRSVDRERHKAYCAMYGDCLMRKCKSVQVTSSELLETSIRSLTEHCVHTMENYSDCHQCMRLLCGVHVNRNFCAVALPESVLSDYHQLDELSKDCNDSLVCKGHEALLRGELARAKDLLLRATSSGSVMVEGFALLCHCCVLVHDYKLALTIANKGIKACPHSLYYQNVALELHKCQYTCYLKTGCSSAARRIIDEVLCKQLDDAMVAVLQARCCVLDGELDKAKQLCEVVLSTNENYHEAWACLGEAQFASSDFEKAAKSLTRAIDISDDVSVYQQMLGKVLWELGGEARTEKTGCFAQFLKAAKLDPFHAETFLYLGHYYHSVLHDDSKSRRCYQKALDLSPSNSEAGAALSDRCLSMGDDCAALALYQQVIKEAPVGEAKWAWLRLGLYQLSKQESTDAVTSFQNVVKSDPEDRRGWECLGDAYLQRGGYVAALKAFTRAVQLDEASLYCMYRIAAIKQTIGMLTGAVEEFETILKQDPNYVPALKGAAESFLFDARSLLKQCFTGRAVDCVSQALQYLARAVAVHPEFVCLWKLIGDSCMTLESVAAERISIVVPKLLQSNVSHQAEMSGKEEILKLSSRAYGQALRLAPSSANIWHDLSLSFIVQSKCKGSIGRKDLLKKALESLKKAVCLCNSNYNYWNSLGVACCLSDVADLALAQHCFIRSLHLNSANAVTWSNLGILYLNSDQKELAHEAFKNAQSTDPESVFAWIGQALIAETRGDTDAADLFRHSTELAVHPQGSVGFAYWVCTNLSAEVWSQELGYGYSCLDDATYRAVLRASDCLAKYTDYIRDDSCAFTMFGLLLELQGLWSEAEQAHATALSLIVESSDLSNVNTARNNCARVLSRLDRHVESVAFFASASPLTDFYDLCLLGLALFKLNRLNDSYKVYEQCIEVAPSVPHKSCVFASLGVVAYALKQSSKAKAFFFKSSQTSPPSPHGIMALCALGLVTKDMTLAVAALSELVKLEDSSSDALSCDIVYMVTRMYTCQGKIKMARGFLSRAIHKYPNRAELWKQLAEFVIRHHSEHSEVASSCALASWKLSRQVSVEVPLLMAAGAVACGNRLTFISAWKEIAIRAAQKAVHAVPCDIRSWAVAAAAALAACISTGTCPVIKYESDIIRLGQLMLVKVEAAYKELQEGVFCGLGCIQSQREKLLSIQCWASEYQIASLLFTGRIQQATAFNEQVLRVFSSQPKTMTSLQLWFAYATLLSKVDVEDQMSVIYVQEFRDVVIRSNTRLMWPWKALAHAYLCVGKPVAASMCLQQSRHLAEKECGAVLMTSSWLASICCLSNPDDDEHGWASMVSETSLKMLKRCDQLPTFRDLGQFLQAVLHAHGKNSSAARRGLERILQRHETSSSMLLDCVQFHLNRLKTERMP